MSLFFCSLAHRAFQKMAKGTCFLSFFFHCHCQGWRTVCNGSQLQRLFILEAASNGSTVSFCCWRQTGRPAWGETDAHSSTFFFSSERPSLRDKRPSERSVKLGSNYDLLQVKGVKALKKLLFSVLNRLRHHQSK